MTRFEKISSPVVRHCGSLSEVPFDQSAATQEVERVISRLLAKIDVRLTGSKAVTMVLKPLTGGRSSARVFKATPQQTGEEVQAAGAPLVLKIGPAEEVTREMANYERYVRLHLPTAIRPQLFGFARAGDHAGLCYSFLGDGAAPTDTLTNCLARAQTTALDLVLRDIVQPLQGGWYASTSIRNESDIARHYLDRYFALRPGPRQTEVLFSRCAEQFFNIRCTAGRYLLRGESLPMLAEALFGAPRVRPYLSCIIHGDLNSDNIVMSRQENWVALVDFQKTGRGHVYEDLLALEASIRINFPADASLGDILQTERLIALGRSPDTPYATSIRKLRNAAMACFGSVEGSANYHFGTAAIGLRLMQASDLSDIARARITASALWAISALCQAPQH